MKINFLKKGKHFGQDNFQTDPHFYWRIILSVFFVFVLIGAFWGFRLFQQTNKENVPFTEKNEGKAVRERKNKIEDVLNYFKEKENKSNEILNLPLGIVDPSL